MLLSLSLVFNVVLVVCVVSLFKQLKNELQDREDLIANLFEEMEKLEADDEPEIEQ